MLLRARTFATLAAALSAVVVFALAGIPHHPLVLVGLIAAAAAASVLVGLIAGLIAAAADFEFFHFDALLIFLTRMWMMMKCFDENHEKVRSRRRRIERRRRIFWQEEQKFGVPF